MKTTPFLMVIWDDAVEHTDETFQPGDFDDDSMRSMPQVSVGHAIKDDEKGVVLARDVVLSTDEIGAVLCIPVQYIVGKRYLA